MKSEPRVGEYTTYGYIRYKAVCTDDMPPCNLCDFEGKDNVLCDLVMRCFKESRTDRKNVCLKITGYRKRYPRKPCGNKK